MHMLGAQLTVVEPGCVEIRLPYRVDLTQQHGFLHGGIVGMILDSACGFAAFSLMPAHAGVLTVEYKINFVAPAKGEAIVAQGRVVKTGRTLTVCWGEAYAESEGQSKLVATMVGTMMTIRGREDVQS
ncbi:MAG: PaaI family thioesterase [Anaerolineae bacterium]|nr:PaaI family thioesterase [Anaerolineae bacterium]